MPPPRALLNQLSQAIQRAPALALGEAGRLQVRAAQALACLSGAPKQVDQARLLRLGITRTSDPIANSLLDVAAAEIEAGNPGANELDTLTGALEGPHDSQAGQLKAARDKAMPKPGEPVTDLDAAYDALDFDQTQGDKKSFFSQKPWIVYEAILDLSPEAKATAKRVMGGGGSNDATDAFRHAYWSFRMAEEFGPETAKVRYYLATMPKYTAIPYA